MSETKKVTSVGIISFLLAAFAILGIGLVLVPSDQRTEAFWWRLAWTEILAILIYLPAFVFYRSALIEENKKIIGILPGLKTTFLLYAAVSFSLMLLNAFHEGKFFPNSIHLALQVVLLFIVGTIFTMSLVAADTASTGLESNFSKGISPSEVCNQIRDGEDFIKGSEHFTQLEALSLSLKKLRELFQYSLPTIGRVVESSDYNNLAESINTLIADITSDQSLIQKKDYYNEKLNSLLSSTRRLSNQFVSR